MSVMEFAPAPLGRVAFDLRPYQEDAIEAIFERLKTDRSTLLILPTGTGKTVVFSALSRRLVEADRRVLILAHRSELIQQAANKAAAFGLDPCIEQAGQYARGLIEPNLVIATVQTLANKPRLKTWPEDFFDLVIVDEAHHATATTYQRVINHFHTAKVLGVTATPDRADDDRLDSYFDSIAYEMNLYDAITAPSPGPYLSRLKIAKCGTRIDLRGLNVARGDYSPAEVEERLMPLVELLANAMAEKIGDRQTIIFTPDRKSASAMSAAMGSLGFSSAYVWGDSTDREETVRDYLAGKIQVLSNCAVFTEGFDAPATSCIAPLRPTKSRNLYSQMIGRGTRLSPGKDHCLILDFDWLTDRHDLVHPADVFDSSRRSDDENALIAKLVKEGADKDQEVDILEAIEKAERDAPEIKEMELKVRLRKTNLKWISYEPVTVADAIGVSFRAAKDQRTVMATERQVAALSRFKVEKAEGMSKRMASLMLDSLVNRAKKKLATHKQVMWLIKKGVEPTEARQMSFSDASARLDQLFKKRPA